MPFGLSTSPSTCQRLMDLAFAGLTYQSILTYLDDIITFGRTFDELIQRMDEVFSRLIVGCSKHQIAYQKVSSVQATGEISRLHDLGNWDRGSTGQN